MSGNQSGSSKEGESGAGDFTPEQQKKLDSIIQTRIGEVSAKKDGEIKELQKKLSEIPQDFNAEKWNKIPKDFDFDFSKIQKSEPPKEGDIGAVIAAEMDKLRKEHEKSMAELTGKFESVRAERDSEILNAKLKGMGVDDKHLKFVGSEVNEALKTQSGKPFEEIVDTVLKDNGLSKVPAQGNGGQRMGNPPNPNKPTSFTEAIMQAMGDKDK
jgi:hypothetical protein